MAPLDDSPRHATPKSARRSWDPGTLIADIKAGVQAQLARTDTQAPVTGDPEGLAGQPTVSQPTVDAGLSDPAGSDEARVGGAAMVAAPTQAAADESRDKRNLRRAAEAAEAAAAQAAGAASQAAITADRAMSEAASARADSAAARQTADTVLAELSAAREEITVLHQGLQTLRERTRRDLYIAWGGGGVALVVAVVALVTG